MWKKQRPDKQTIEKIFKYVQIYRNKMPTKYEPTDSQKNHKDDKFLSNKEID